MNEAEWLKKSMRISFQGPAVSWLFSIAQTGDTMSINVNEKDIVAGPLKFPKTVVSIVPPFIGWQLPIDPQFPGHWLPMQGKYNINKVYSLTG